MMKQTILGNILIACVGWPAFGQTAGNLPAFEAADVHVSSKINGRMQFVRTEPVRRNRYTIKYATLVDLIRMAYGFDNDKILEGPSWIEMDRFDVTAKVPSDSTPDMQKQMLQTLLQDRFKLVVRKDTKPLPAYALVAGKKPQMKEAGGSEQPGCRVDSGPAGQGGAMLMMNGSPIRLGPGMTVQYSCRNLTMAEFAANVRTMIGASMGTNNVIDATGLAGKWNFDIHYSLQIFGPLMPSQSERISFADAVEKQLGLKLEERQVPTPVLVVVSANRTPAENPPGTAEALPPIPMPTEFEVASIKSSDPGSHNGRFAVQPGGRLVAEGMPLSFLISRAFNSNNNEELVGVPAFAQSDRYDVTAKVPSNGPTITSIDYEAIAPMLLALLKERFKLEYHKDERPVNAYSLVAGKPKLKKADPDSRIYCRTSPAPPGAPPGSQTLKCQNTTMAMFAERLQYMSPELAWPVENDTGLEGSYDFSIAYTMRRMAMPAGPGRGGEPNSGAPAGAAGALPEASDPVEGYTIFEAIEKQLGLKLEKRKRTMPVIVIDHMERTPTEN